MISTILQYKYLSSLDISIITTCQVQQCITTVCSIFKATPNKFWKDDVEFYYGCVN